MSRCDFNKVALQLYRDNTSAWVSPVNLLHIFRIPFLKNTSGRLLLLIGMTQPEFALFKARMETAKQRVKSV